MNDFCTKFSRSLAVSISANSPRSRVLLWLMGLVLCCGMSAQAQTTYYNGLVASLNQQYGAPSSGRLLIGGDETTVTSNPNAWYWTSSGASTMSGQYAQAVTDAPGGTGGSFSKKAIFTQSADGQTQFGRLDYQDSFAFRTTSPDYAQNDNLLLTFWAKGQNASGGKGMMVVGIIGGAGSTWFGFRSVNFDNTWRRYFLYVKASEANAPGLLTRAQFSFGVQHQTVHIAGLALIDYGSTSTGLFALNNSGYNYDTYGGKTTAGQEAYQTDVSSNRKTTLTVAVKDANGNAVSGASVQIKQKKHAFSWGGDESACYVLIPACIDNAGHQKSLQDTNFDGTANDQFTMVIDETLALGPQSGFGYPGHTNDYDYTYMDQVVNWYQQHGMQIHAHTLAWGDAEGVSSDVPRTMASIRTRIDNITKRYKGKINAYCLLNETYNRRAWENGIFNGDLNAYAAEVAEWSKIAHTNDPNAKLFLSDNDMLENGGLQENRVQFYEKFIAAIKNAGGYIDGFAFQSHFGNDSQNDFTDIAQVKTVLDRFGALGLKCRISEFDFFNYSNSTQRAKYLRDFVNVCFANPNVDAFLMWNRGPGGWTSDPYGVSSGLLYLDSSGENAYQLSPTGQAWWDMVFNKYWTNATATTPTNGQVSQSVFKGDYDVIVTPQGGTPQTVSVPDVTSAKTVNVTVGATLALRTNRTTNTYSAGEPINLFSTIAGMSLNNLKVQYFKDGTFIGESDTAADYAYGFPATVTSGGNYLAKAVNIWSGAVVAISNTVKIIASQLTLSASRISTTVGQPVNFSSRITSIALNDLKVQYFKDGVFFGESDTAADYALGFTPSSTGSFVWIAKTVNVWSGAVLATSNALTIIVKASGQTARNDIGRSGHALLAARSGLDQAS